MKNIHLLFIYLFTLLIFILIINIEAYPQSSEIDSLKNVIAGQRDSPEKADNLLKVGRHFYFEDYDSSFLYYEKAYILSEKLNYTQGRADALYVQSIIYKARADFKSSLSYIEKYIELVLYLEDSLRLAKGYYQLANALLDFNDIELALYYSQKSLELYIPLNDTVGILSNYNVLGLVYNLKAEYDSAALYYLKSVDLCERIGDDYKLATVLTNVGIVYKNDEQFESALKYTNMSLELNRKNNNTRGMADNFYNLGGLMSQKLKYNEALDYYSQAKTLFELNGDMLGIYYLYNDYGNLFFDQKNFKAALVEYDKALQGFRRIGFIHGMVIAFGNIAASYSELGNIEKALSMQDSCLVLTYQEGNKDYRITVLQNIANNYRKAGNYKKAFGYLQHSYDLKDTIFNIKKTKIINDLIQKYEKEKDQANILALEKDNLQKDLDLRKRTGQRNMYLFVGLAIMVITLFLIFYYRQRASKNEIIAQQKIRQLEEEKKLISARLLVEGQEKERKRIATELHDGLGVLLSATKMQFSAISDTSPENRGVIEKATRMLEQATSDVRKISHNMMPGLLTKLGFFEAVEGLFEDIGDSGSLNAVCTITGNPERLAENKEIMLYRIVQELVNNTLKYAQAGNIEIQIRVLPQMIEMIYSDDGIGFNFQQHLETETIGLQSIQSRVNFLNGTLIVKSNPGEGVKYSMQIPV